MAARHWARPAGRARLGGGVAKRVDRRGRPARAPRGGSCEGALLAEVRLIGDYDRTRGRCVSLFGERWMAHSCVLG